MKVPDIINHDDFAPGFFMQNTLNFLEAELLFQEVSIHGIPYLLPVLDLPNVQDREVHICRGTLRQALSLEKILQNRHESSSDS